MSEPINLPPPSVSPPPKVDIRRLTPTTLAYLGDALYELHVRQHLLLPIRKLRDYHRRVVARVRAQAQADMLQTLMPHLTAEEQGIVQRGRNAASRVPRNVSIEVYRQATAFEALLGYLHLTQPDRLTVILALTDTIAEQDGPET